MPIAKVCGFSTKISRFLYYLKCSTIAILITFVIVKQSSTKSFICSNITCIFLVKGQSTFNMIILELQLHAGAAYKTVDEIFYVNHNYLPCNFILAKLFTLIITHTIISMMVQYN